MRAREKFLDILFSESEWGWWTPKLDASLHFPPTPHPPTPPNPGTGCRALDLWSDSASMAQVLGMKPSTLLKSHLPAAYLTALPLGAYLGTSMTGWRRAWIVQPPKALLHSLLESLALGQSRQQGSCGKISGATFCFYFISHPCLSVCFHFQIMRWHETCLLCSQWKQAVCK